MINKRFVNEISKIRVNIIKTSEILKNHSTFKIGGKATYFITPTSIIEVKRVLEIVKKYKIRHMFLGNGSNVLFDSRGYKGAVIKLRLVSSQSEGVLMASELLAITSYKYYQKGIDSLAHLAMIPASIGGAIIMNAGVKQKSMSDIIEYVYYLDEDLNLRVRTNEECDFSYRNSYFKANPKLLVLGCKIKTTKRDKSEIKKIMDDERSARKAAQPLEYPSAGSVFKNPIEAPAWKLISSVDLKGYKRGGAMVSEKHANFIINTGDAKSKDVLYLIELIRKKVYHYSGIKLIREIIVIDRR